MESLEYRMMFIEKDGMKFLETIKKKIKIGGVTQTNLKKKVMQTIDFIKQFTFYVLFFLGCGIVLLIIGLLWITDQVMDRWQK